MRLGPRLSDRTVIRFTLWFLGAGVLFALAAGATWFAERHALRADQVCMGTITEYVPRQNPDGHVLFYPHVRFRTPDGVLHDFFLPDGTNPAPFTSGGTVAVIFPAGHPEAAHLTPLRAVGHPWSAALAFAAIALFDIGVVFWIIFQLRRRRAARAAATPPPPAAL